MARVTVELWMGMGEELGDDFKSPSNTRSVLETVVEDGTTVGKFFEDLADRYRPIGEKVFSNHEFAPYVVVTMNDRIISADGLPDRVLENGDKIMVFHMYVGG